MILKVWLHCLSSVWQCISGAAAPGFGQHRAPPSRSSSFGSDTSGAGPGPFYPSPAPPTPGGARPMARAPAFGGAQQGGFSQPGGPGAQLAPNYGTPQNQAVLDQFEALTLGPAAPGQPGDAGKPQKAERPRVCCDLALSCSVRAAVHTCMHSH